MRPAQGNRVLMGAGASKTLFNTRNNDFFLIQMADNVKGMAEQEVVFLFLKCVTSVKGSGLVRVFLERDAISRNLVTVILLRKLIILMQIAHT